MRLFATVRLTAPRLLAVAGVAVVLSASLALAASLSTTTDKVGGAAASVPRCATTGVTTVEVLTGTNITGVTVSGIDSNCAAGTLAVTVNVGGGTTGAGSVAVPAGGGSATVPISPAVAFVGNAQIDAEITGP
jgi:hypothetical protein